MEKMGSKIGITAVLVLLFLIPVVKGMDQTNLETMLDKAWDKSMDHLRDQKVVAGLDPNDYLKDLRAAVDKKEFDFKNTGRKHNDWPLLIFAWNDDAEYVGKLLDAGADVNVGDRDGFNALHYCGQYNCVKAAACLIEHGANVNLKNKWGDTPLIQACVCYHSEMVSLLIAAKVDLNVQGQYGPAIFYAMRDPGMVKQFIDAGADVNARNPKDGETALIHAAHDGNLQSLRLLLDAGAKLDATNRAGRSAFLESLMNGQYETAEALLDAGADWRLKDADGNTAIDYAANLPAPGLVDRLAKLGANTNDIHLFDLHLSRVKNTAHLWPYALTAIQMIFEGLHYDELEGSQTRETKGKLDAKLINYWGIHSKEDAMLSLSNLASSSVNMEFEKIAGAVAGLSDQKFEQEQDDLLLSDPHLRHQRQVVREYLAKGGKGDLLGWQAVHYILLLQLCRASGYANDKDCWNKIETMLEPLQKRFSSWEEFARNVRAGYAFNGSLDSEQYDFVERMLLNKADKASPWNMVDWKIK